MKMKRIFVFLSGLFASYICTGQSIYTAEDDKPFLFGVATAAYQIEGAFDTDGRGMSVWDEWTHRNPSPIFDKSTGDVAADSYHNLDRDIALLKFLGVQSYRFSISWSRVLPTGDIANINQKGVDYYNGLINQLLDAKIIPFVTMFHWDTPLELQKNFGGFSNRIILDFFENYAKILFEKFGDRVKHWITFNEPNEFCSQGYGGDTQAPGMNFRGYGDYLCMHHAILSHVRAYKLYDKEFRSSQQGEIGITLNNRFAFAEENQSSEVVERFMTFTLGWKMDPLFSKPFHGYPELMKREIEKNSRMEGRSHSRLPEFSSEDQELFNGNVVDFLGLNYYTSRIVSPGQYSPTAAPSYDKDLNVTMRIDPSWIRAKSTWLYDVPEGLHQLLLWIKNKYNSPRIYVTENGWSDEGEVSDVDRVNYLNSHLKAVQRAMSERVNVLGYFHWSLMDNFEWERGYTEKFGLVQINFTTPSRGWLLKSSAFEYRDIISRGILAL